MKGLLKYIDEVNEIVGVLVFLYSVVMHLLGNYTQEAMLAGMATAASIYIGLKGVKGVAALFDKDAGKDEGADEG